MDSRLKTSSFGLDSLRTLVESIMGAKQQVKIWSLTISPSLNNSNIAHRVVKAYTLYINYSATIFYNIIFIYMHPSHPSSFSPDRSSGGVVVTLLDCGARGPWFDSRSRRYDFRDWLSPISK